MLLHLFAKRHGWGQRRECCYDLTGNMSGICPECGAVVRCRKSSIQGESPVMVRLRSRSLLRRVLSVSTPQGVYVVEYNGWGLNFDTVYVNGHVAVRRRSLFWFVPQFKFCLGGQAAVLNVSVWPWLTFRRFSLSLDRELVYQEEQQKLFPGRVQWRAGSAPT